MLIHHSRVATLVSFSFYDTPMVRLLQKLLTYEISI
jgi:hypothetical protein